MLCWYPHVHVHFTFNCSQCARQVWQAECPTWWQTLQCPSLSRCLACHRTSKQCRHRSGWTKSVNKYFYNVVLAQLNLSDQVCYVSYQLTREQYIVAAIWLRLPWFDWLVGFFTSLSTTRLYRGRAPRQSVWQFNVLPHMSQSWETMASETPMPHVLPLPLHRIPWWVLKPTPTWWALPCRVSQAQTTPWCSSRCSYNTQILTSSSSSSNNSSHRCRCSNNNSNRVRWLNHPTWRHR